MTRIKFIYSIVGLVLYASIAHAQTLTDKVSPESASPKFVTLADVMPLSDQASASLAKRDAGKPIMAKNWMVVAAHPLAVEAGAKILDGGGTSCGCNGGGTSRTWVS